MTKSKAEFQSRIDTIQTKEPTTNRVEWDREVMGKEETLNKKGELITKWNVNNMLFEYSNEYKLSTTKKRLVELMELATVINYDDVKMNRIDIATDSYIDFVENSKLIYLLHRCLTAKIKGGKSWNNEDDNDFNYSNFRFANRDWNIEFYDKDKESEGKSLYNTRFEVRHLRVKAQDFEYHIEKTIQLWQGALNNLEVVEKVQLDKLYDKWDKMKAENPKTKFTTFVDTYKHKILTFEMLSKLMKYANLKGSPKSWLQKYRNTHTIELYSDKDVKRLVKEIVKSLKTYKKS